MFTGHLRLVRSVPYGCYGYEKLTPQTSTNSIAIGSTPEGDQLAGVGGYVGNQFQTKSAFEMITVSK